MNENLALHLARVRVHGYADESSEMRRQESAIDGRRLEDFLQRGIDAHEWLRRAEDTMREAAYEGIFDFTEDLRCAIDGLYVAWSEQCVLAERWIESVTREGHPVDNLDEFRRTCEEVHDVVNGRDWRRRAAAARAMTLSEESW